jgi:hypothetical protein
MLVPVLVLVLVLLLLLLLPLLLLLAVCCCCCPSLGIPRTELGDRLPAEIGLSGGVALIVHLQAKATLAFLSAEERAGTRRAIGTAGSARAGVRHCQQCGWQLG